MTDFGILDNPKVAAVIVTYNRLNKLKKALRSIESQTFQPSLTIVVDNSSNDGTADYLRQYSLDRNCNNRVVKILSLKDNIGGAGGFSEGLEEACRHDIDYIWLFDDDCYPDPEALKKLIKGVEAASKTLECDVPFACSVVRHTDGTICQMNNPETTWDWGRLIVKSLPLVLVKSCSFVSFLVPKHIVQQFGLPYKEYFIWYDDSEYSSRISKDTPGVQVLDSFVTHDMDHNEGVSYAFINNENAWKFSFGIRNQASFNLHHKGFGHYLLYCTKVIIVMHRGKVPFRLRLSMIKQMLKAISFNPSIEYPD